MFGYTGYKKSAFTLAEVLITLGVIGVVAAMTIPTLTLGYQKQVVEAKLKKAFSVATNACEQMLTQENVYGVPQTELYGHFISSSASATNVNNTLKKYFNTIKDTVSKDATYGWPIYLPDDSTLYISASGGGGFKFTALPYPKRTKYLYEFTLAKNCSYDNSGTSDAAKAFKTVLENGWKLPD